MKSKTGAKNFRNYKNHVNICAYLYRIWYKSNSGKVRHVVLRHLMTLSTTSTIRAKQSHVNYFFLALFLSLTPST